MSSFTPNCCEFSYESYTREEVCGGIPESAFVVADYDWPEACECPCAYARYWFVLGASVSLLLLVLLLVVLVLAVASSSSSSFAA